MFADRDLAVRLETIAAAEMQLIAQTALALDSTCPAATLDILGGLAVFVHPDSPVNRAMGMGFSAPAAAEDVSRLDAFYRTRGERPLAVVCPLADPSLTESLSAAGWTVDGFENVLYRRVSPVADADCDRFEDFEIIEAIDDEQRAAWADIAARGFSAPLPPLATQVTLARILAARPGPRLFIVLVDGRAAGVGELFVRDGVAWLSADTTLPRYRRLGIQQALQAFRLKLAREMGCELAVSEALPGSGSQRNMERNGFRVAYTRVDLLAPAIHR